MRSNLQGGDTGRQALTALAEATGLLRRCPPQTRARYRYILPRYILPRPPPHDCYNPPVRLHTLSVSEDPSIDSRMDNEIKVFCSLACIPIADRCHAQRIIGMDPFTPTINSQTRTSQPTKASAIVLRSLSYFLSFSAVRLEWKCELWSIVRATSTMKISLRSLLYTTPSGRRVPIPGGHATSGHTWWAARPQTFSRSFTFSSSNWIACTIRSCVFTFTPANSAFPQCSKR